MELYISTDIETDGPSPGDNSMLSFGSAAFRENGDLIGTFTRNLETLPGANPNRETMAWWATEPEAWKNCRTNLTSPEVAMFEYYNWLVGLRMPTVFVGYPAGFDFTYIYWYLMKYVGKSPFSFSAIDIKTYAMAMLKSQYKNTTKRNMPKSWFPKDKKHTHIALDDAIEQGYLFMNMLKANNAPRK